MKNPVTFAGGDWTAGDIASLGTWQDMGLSVPSLQGCELWWLLAPELFPSA